MTDQPTPAALNKARFMALTDSPMTQEAFSLGKALAAAVVPGSGRNKARRGHHQTAFEHAAAVFAADLLKAHRGSSDGWARRPFQTASFNGQTVSHKAFMQLVKGGLAADLIEKHNGGYRRIDWGDGVQSGYGWQTRIRGTAKLLALAETCGITTDNVDQHFVTTESFEPLVLKSSPARFRQTKVSGRSLKFPETTRTHELRAEVEELNRFLAAQTITGGEHRGYRRIFNQGDMENHGWAKGGRLYSIGEGSYQLLKKERRREIKINGEPVVEMDIRASFLTILHGLKHFLFDPKDDPYSVDQLPRDVVKAWVTMTLGHTRFHRRWTPEKVAEFKDRGVELGKRYPIKQVETSVLARLPILKDWPGQRITFFDLMYMEGRAMLSTMLALMRDHATPSLSVHDSLIVSASAQAVAMDLLKKNYKDVAGIEPFVEVGSTMSSDHPDLTRTA